MFGIGLGEFVIVAIVLLIAVGPKSMPKLMRAVGKGVREFRAATRELRNQVGLDELMRDEELREQWRDPLGLKQQGGGGPAPHRDAGIAQADREREYPPQGVDLRDAEATATHEPEERSGAEG